MDLRIDEERNIAYIKITGPASSREILDAFDMTVSDKRYKKGMGRLWDFRDADLSSINSETVREMAHYSTRLPPGINDVKVAFVTGRELEYGLSRMFEMSSRDRTPIRTFHTIEEAEKWMMEGAHV